MEKRAFLAVVLSIVVFYLFSMVFGPDKKQVSPPPPQNISQSSPAAILPSVPPVAPSLPLTTDNQKDVTVDTGLYTAVFSSRGAALKSMTLKKYREQNSPAASLVVLGNNVDPALLTFSTRATGFNLSDSTLFVPDAETVKVSGAETKQLTYNYVSGQGFTIRKIYTFGADSYSIKLETQVFNNSAAPMVGTIQQIMSYPSEPKVKDNRFDTAGSYLYADNALHADKFKDVASSSKKYDKNVIWAGFADKYFLSAILAEKNSISTAELKKSAAGFMESIFY
jgi:YidC/Oxa1 family membrane protein insertase